VDISLEVNELAEMRGSSTGVKKLIEQVRGVGVPAEYRSVDPLRITGFLDVVHRPEF
jgi:hypothetical protein